MSKDATSQLDQLANEIRGLLADIHNAQDRQNLRYLEVGARLLSARDRFKSNIDFGRWCDVNAIDLNKDDRAALIAMAREPERAREVLGKTERTSIRLIYARDFRLLSAEKTEPKRKPISPRDEDIIKAWDAGTAPKDIAANVGLVERRVHRIIEDEKIRRHEREENSPEVLKAFLQSIYEEQVKKADAVLKAWTAQEGRDRGRWGWPFTGDEFRKLLAVLHPDAYAATSPERRNEVFNLVKAKENQLRSPVEPGETLRDKLPRTVEELMARRDEATRKRSAARQRARERKPSD